MSAIANIYAKKVSNGERTIESVPENIRTEVAEILGIELDIEETDNEDEV
ncbi:MAG: hypothetical protein LUI87_02350 [Lachnospiraceae bacterium]|nr:hypothetical protein [Lachnospiraceae bacterium]